MSCCVRTKNRRSLVACHRTPPKYIFKDKYVPNHVCDVACYLLGKTQYFWQATKMLLISVSSEPREPVAGDSYIKNVASAPLVFLK